MTIAKLVKKLLKPLILALLKGATDEVSRWRKRDGGL